MIEKNSILNDLCIQAMKVYYLYSCLVRLDTPILLNIIDKHFTVYKNN